MLILHNSLLSAHASQSECSLLTFGNLFVFMQEITKLNWKNTLHKSVVTHYKIFLVFDSHLLLEVNQTRRILRFFLIKILLIIFVLTLHSSFCFFSILKKNILYKTKTCSLKGSPLKCYPFTIYVFIFEWKFLFIRSPFYRFFFLNRCVL